LFWQFRPGRYWPFLPQFLGQAQRSTRSVTVAGNPLSTSAPVGLWFPGLLRTKAPRKLCLPWSSAVKASPAGRTTAGPSEEAGADVRKGLPFARDCAPGCPRPLHHGRAGRGQVLVTTSPLVWPFT